MHTSYMKRLFSICTLFISTGLVAQVREVQQASDKGERMIRGSENRLPQQDPLSFVNPFIGTGGHGHTFPGPVVPFGGVQVGPDTRPEGWDGCGGYHYSDSVIYGFSHTHLSGVGVPDYADLLVVPQIGKALTIPAYKAQKGKGYGAKFSHKNERATPGSYSVKLDNGISVDLTATAHGAIHRYTFPEGKDKKYIVLDLGYRDRVIEAGAQVEGKNTIKGFRRSEAWARDQHFYFQLVSSVYFKKVKRIIHPEKYTYVMVLEFPADTKIVDLKVAVSGTDQAGATLNYESELKRLDLLTASVAAAQQWRLELYKISATSKDPIVLTNFYTALYHSYVHPSLWSDVDGRFRGFDHKLYTSPFANYSVFSLWDTYRGANPLYTITQHQRTIDFVESFRLQYQQTGLLPMWTLSNNETNCMIGYHAIPVITDAYLKGIELNDPEHLLEAMIASSTYDHLGKKHYASDGFISAELEPESVSKTLEYAYDDWCIARFAEKLGKMEVAARYDLRASQWMNLLHPESGFIQPRKGGLWLKHFKPEEVNHHFTEANGYQYSLAMPHHISEVVSLKGTDGLEKFLDSIFENKRGMSGREQADITGLIGQYAHGNEPSHHMAYLYNYAGNPAKTALYVDRILREYYTNNPDGLSGNEDCGQMSAWYVLSAMGFYPVAPGSPTYALGRPLMDRVEIRSGKVPFVIETKNNSPANKYIQKMLWNGQQYTKLFISHDMITAGGIMQIEMGAEPNKALEVFEVDLKDRVSGQFVSVPYFIAHGEVFADSVVVGIDKLPSQEGEIYYSLDNEQWNLLDEKHAENLVLRDTKTVYAKIVLDQGRERYESKTVKTTFVKYVPDKQVVSISEYANQYAGAGKQTVADGMRGGNEYRGTEWQGFQGKDVEVVLELNQRKEISAVEVSALRELRSWIFPPKGAEVYVSMDGKHFKKVGQVEFRLTDRDESGKQVALNVEFAPTEALYVKVVVRNFGLCPEWHLGAGNNTWLFLDEITVR